MIDWSSARLVIFDVDGTLYSQRKLRMRMAAVLAAHTARSGSLRTAAVLSAYRRWREVLAEEGVENFEQELMVRLLDRFGLEADVLNRILHDWLEVRPLRHLSACRYPGIRELFKAIRASGREIGILSDYPAEEKLRAMGLEADFIVCARDPDVSVLKPDPRGLLKLLRLADVSPHEAILIGDRGERDGEAGRRAGVLTYIRTSAPQPGWPCFESFKKLNVSALHAGVAAA